MAEVHRYRGHTIKFSLQRSPTTLYWRARGTIGYTEGRKVWTFIIAGAADIFVTAAEARDAFLQQAQQWIDNRLSPKSS